jgi:phosphoribosylglycinamide formyltransferase-1
VLGDDDEDSLAARILTAEHQCYPQAVRLIAEGRVRLEGDLARIGASSDQGKMLISPGPQQ